MHGGVPRRAVALGLAGWAGCALAAHAQETVIAQRESPYNTIYVVREGRYIALQFGVNRRIFHQSLYNPENPRELLFAYTRYMTAGLAYTASLNAICEIGLGGGRTAQYLHLHMPGVPIQCVELDPEVIALAQQYFGVTPERNLTITQADGRIFLRRARERFDLIFIDAYRGTFVPFHLLTREFFQTVKRRVAPGGAVVQNIEPTTMLYDAAIATLKAVFDHVDIYQADGNVVAIAYDGPVKGQRQLRARAAALQSQYNFRHPIAPMLDARRVVSSARGQVLTDDFAPVESLRAMERHNQRQ
ncbi:MAG: methyltransferase domain-containing protein [Alphaproteobacteria bacterium]|nr:methyltransferase domain-containing protein [Alphaproteobacteria bacterium]